MFCRQVCICCFVVSLVPGFVVHVENVSAFQEVTEPTSSARYQKYLKELMAVVDINKDGQIDQTEAEKNFRPVFQNADLDRDGIITGEEILKTVAPATFNFADKSAMNMAARSNGIAVDATTSYRLTVTVLKLPNSYAQAQVVSIDDVLRKLSIRDGDEQVGDLAPAIPLLDQLELELNNGRTSELSLGAVKSVVKGTTSRNGKTYRNFSDMNVGSSLQVKPQMDGSDIAIEVGFQGSYIVGNSGKRATAQDEGAAESSVVQVVVETDLMFHENKTVSAVNMLVSGYHILVLFKIDPI